MRNTNDYFIFFINFEPAYCGKVAKGKLILLQVVSKRNNIIYFICSSVTSMK